MSEGAGANVDCEPCPRGKYNKAFTDSTTACEDKTRIGACAQGKRLVLGTATHLDDWKCATCAAGWYADQGRDVVWPGNGGYPAAVSYATLVELPAQPVDDADATNLQACTDECDSDSQCAAGLMCFQREGEYDESEELGSSEPASFS